MYINDESRMVNKSSLRGLMLDSLLHVGLYKLERIALEREAISVNKVIKGTHSVILYIHVIRRYSANP